MIETTQYSPMLDDGVTEYYQQPVAPALDDKPEDSHITEGSDKLLSMNVEEKDLAAESVPVNVVALHTLFMKYFPLIATSASSADNALEELKSIKISTDSFGFVPLFTDFVDKEKGDESVYSQLWVHIPDRFSPTKEEFYLNFRIDRGPFYSQYLPDSTSNRTFNYLSIYEDEEQKPFIYMRLGDEGEILWLSKGDKLRGGTVKKLCLNILSEIPIIPTSYLMDAATINLREKQRHSINVHKIYLSMVLALASDDGESWYGRSGFSPVKCKDRVVKNGDSVSQDPNLYYKAVEKLRELRFDTLCTTFSRYKTRLQLLQSCVRDDANPTLHEIFKYIHGETREYPRNSDDAIAAETRLYNFYTNFLDPESFKTMPTKNKQVNLYYLAIKTLREHVIWQKGFMADAINMSYDRFRTFPHSSFDATMNSVVAKRPFKWQLPAG